MVCKDCLQEYLKVFNSLIYLRYLSEDYGMVKLNFSMLSALGNADKYYIWIS